MTIRTLIWLMMFSAEVIGQRYDFSTGDTSSIKACNRFQDWFPVSADAYPEHPSAGPLEGFILRSPLEYSNCISLVQNINLYEDSIFYIDMYSESSSDSLTIYVLYDTGEVIRDWLFIKGKEGWTLEESGIPLFTVSNDKQYNIEIVTTAIPVASFTSIRYFEITNASESTSTPTTITTTEITTDDSSSTSTEIITDDSSSTKTEIITDASSSTTTEIVTDDSSSTTEMITDAQSSTAELTTASLTFSSDAPTTESNTNTPGNTPPTNNPPFEVDAWSVVIGIAIGIVIATLLYAVAAVAWWIYCLRCRPYKNAPMLGQSNSLPRLQVVSKPGSGPGITAQASQSSYKFAMQPKNEKSKDYNYRRT